MKEVIVYKNKTNSTMPFTVMHAKSKKKVEDIDDILLYNPTFTYNKAKKRLECKGFASENVNADVIDTVRSCRYELTVSKLGAMPTSIYMYKYVANGLKLTPVKKCAAVHFKENSMFFNRNDEHYTKSELKLYTRSRWDAYEDDDYEEDYPDLDDDYDGDY